MAGETKFTPGPWKISDDPYENNAHRIVIRSGHNLVCTVGNGAATSDHAPTAARWRIESPANARLIAAAPDLLAALQALDCSDILGCAESCASGHERWDHVNRKITAARAILAKIGGAS